MRGRREEYSSQTLKVKPNSKALFQEGVIDTQTVFNGSVIYPLNLGIEDDDDCGCWELELQVNDGAETIYCDLRESLDNIRADSLEHFFEDEAFSEQNDELFLYENGQYFYNFPLS
jgi:hypothetical protein